MPRIEEQLLYRYPQHLRDAIDHLPGCPGVYFFWAAESRVPLYIGKSRNIRSRVLSHLRTVKEAKLLRQTEKITYVETAGDIGAQLLEATLIKQLIPLHNKQLRKQRTLYSLHWVNQQLQCVSSTQKDFAKIQHLYGLYRNKRAAQQFIRNLADEHQLCLAALGLESRTQGRPCFRAMLGKCRGVCQGKENLAEHIEALAHWQIKLWPYHGRIAIHEQRGEIDEYHIVDHWRYISTVTNLQSLNLGDYENTFDADSYRILCRALFTPEVNIIPLE